VKKARTKTNRDKQTASRAFLGLTTTERTKQCANLVAETITLTVFGKKFARRAATEKDQMKEVLNVPSVMLARLLLEKMALVKLVMLANTAIHQWNRLHAFSVLPVGILKGAVQNVKLVKLEKQHTVLLWVTHAKIVMQGSIARAVWKLLLVAKIVPLVLVKVIKVKRRAYHAVQVNSMMLTVRLHANHVQS
jgi:hypothetical protein